MLNFIKSFFVGSLFCPRPSPLVITDFREMRQVSTPNDVFPNDYFVPKKPGGRWLEYYDNTESIAYIRYYVTTRQVGLFFIKTKYQNRGLGKQILSKVIKEMRENNCDELWAVTSKNHTFWSNVYNKSFEFRDPAHPSVTGDGYVLDLKKFKDL